MFSSLCLVIGAWSGCFRVPTWQGCPSREISVMDHELSIAAALMEICLVLQFFCSLSLSLLVAALGGDILLFQIFCPWPRINAFHTLARSIIWCISSSSRLFPPSPCKMSQLTTTDKHHCKSVTPSRLAASQMLLAESLPIATWLPISTNTHLGLGGWSEGFNVLMWLRVLHQTRFYHVAMSI